MVDRVVIDTLEGTAVIRETLPSSGGYNFGTIRRHDSPALTQFAQCGAPHLHKRSRCAGLDAQMPR